MEPAPGETREVDVIFVVQESDTSILLRTQGVK
jgi:hypothetical protein